MKSPERPREGLFESEPTITAIAALPSDPNLRRVKCGRSTLATLRAVDVERLSLRVGMTLTGAVNDAIVNAAEIQNVRVQARRVLARRMRSAGEMRDRLRGKGHDADIVETVVQELIKDGWIDDLAYGRAVVDAATRTRPAGRKLLKQKLEARKIESDAVLGEGGTDDSGSDVEAAVVYARRQWLKMTELPRPKAVRRLIGYLSRRGYEDQTVAEVLHRLRIDSPSE